VRFSGRLTSPSGSCESARAVTVYRTNGDVVGTDRADQHGNWHIQAQDSAGFTKARFYAKVNRLARYSHDPASHTEFVCESAKSKTVPYQLPYHH
jgi:hypothetical protein